MTEEIPAVLSQAVCGETPSTQIPEIHHDARRGESCLRAICPPKILSSPPSLVRTPLPASATLEPLFPSGGARDPTTPQPPPGGVPDGTTLPSHHSPAALCPAATALARLPAQSPLHSSNAALHATQRRLARSPTHAQPPQPCTPHMRADYPMPRHHSPARHRNTAHSTAQLPL